MLYLMKMSFTNGNVIKYFRFKKMNLCPADLQQMKN